jgi:hypothetical protein
MARIPAQPSRGNTSGVIPAEDLLSTFSSPLVWALVTVAAFFYRASLSCARISIPPCGACVGGPRIFVLAHATRQRSRSLTHLRLAKIRLGGSGWHVERVRARPRAHVEGGCFSNCAVPLGFEHHLQPTQPRLRLRCLRLGELISLLRRFTSGSAPAGLILSHSAFAGLHF